jgi:flagellar biosynthesis protein FliQ
MPDDTEVLISSLEKGDLTQFLKTIAQFNDPSILFIPKVSSFFLCAMVHFFAGEQWKRSTLGGVL